MTSILEAPELVGRAASSVVATLAAVLVPKCPLCIAAYLAGVGASAGVAQSAATFVRPAVFALAAIALSAFALQVWRSRKRRVVPSCCSH